MITFNIDPESSKAAAGVAKRFADVVYTLCVISFCGFIIGAFLSNEKGVLPVLLSVGGFLYGFGWVVRFIITGNKNYLFKSFFERQAQIVKEKSKNDKNQ